MCVGWPPYLFHVERWRPCLLCMSSFSRPKAQTVHNHTRRHYSADYRHGMNDGSMEGGSGKRAGIVVKSDESLTIGREKQPLSYLLVLSFANWLNIKSSSAWILLPLQKIKEGQQEDGERWWFGGGRGFAYAGRQAELNQSNAHWGATHYTCARHPRHNTRPLSDSIFGSET